MNAMEIRLTSGQRIAAEAGESIYQTLKNNGIHLVSSCGGKGVCGKCRIRLIEGRSRVASTGKLRKSDVDEKFVLACQAFPKGNILIEIPEESRLIIGDKIAISKSKNLLEFLNKVDPGLSPAVISIDLNIEPPTLEDNLSDLERLKKVLEVKGIQDMRFSNSFVALMAKNLRSADWKVSLAYTENFEAVSLSSTGDRNRFGVAIDIGTTTVVLYLVNYYDGSLVDVGLTYNSQMRFGDDVITRIIYATEGGGLNELRNAVISDINDLLLPLMEKHEIKKEDIDSAVVSGNTTMSHLFWGADPASIREEPYIPTLNSFPLWSAGTAKIKMNPRAPVYTLPCVGSYVGGDIVAGVLASKMYLNPEVALFMDIGTNGEIAIGNNEWLITAACSAGPCFEGSGIRHGMRATDGAIESVKISTSDFSAELGVIGDTNPTGICGSGMIDTISELFISGLIDQKGKFVKDIKTDKVKIEEEGPEFILYRGELKDIVLTEVDIENIIRAKAAIYAGVSLLLKEIGLTLDVVSHIYIAGGFGNYLDVDKAVMIGMLPDFPKEKFSFIGNASIAGSYLCLLSEKMRKEAEAIARRMTYIELSVSSGFMDEYMSSLFLPHTNIELFPTVKDIYKKNT
jgi:uncharacterized 2Fe-2S/4Fe-4S cluster protein (DUF4445 family)